MKLSWDGLKWSDYLCVRVLFHSDRSTCFGWLRPAFQLVPRVTRKVMYLRGKEWML
jgi:hypothetical protein